MTDDDGQRLYEALCAWISEQTGIDQAVVRQVMEAMHAFWQERPDSRWAALQQALIE